MNNNLLNSAYIVRVSIFYPELMQKAAIYCYPFDDFSKAINFYADRIVINAGVLFGGNNNVAQISILNVKNKVIERLCKLSTKEGSGVLNDDELQTFLQG
jgi:hypothetical protein